MQIEDQKNRMTTADWSGDDQWFVMFQTLVFDYRRASHHIIWRSGIAFAGQRRSSCEEMQMVKKTILVAAFAVVAAWFCVSSLAQRGPAADTRTAAVAAAAQTFIGSLDDSQRSKVVFDFKDAEQRKRWSNLPVSSVPRAGLRMGDLTQPQREAAMAVLKVALSPQGYEKVTQIVEADEALRAGGGGGGKAGRGKGGEGKAGDEKAKGDKAKGDKAKGGKGGGKGGGASFGRDNYFISFLGQPSVTAPFMIQFGGHHLGLNITFAGEQGTLAPSHTGAQPARFELEGKTVRPLGREVDKAFALYSSLDEAQRKQATLGFEMRDLALGPGRGRDGQMIEPEGIKGSNLTEKQREMLIDLASEWTGIMHEAAATAKLEEVKKNIGETWFAWSGPPEKGGAAYFRIHGPTAFIEFVPQRLGGDPTNHIHTIYRDPINEYGAKWWKP
jgi:hypothetical protein